METIFFGGGCFWCTEAPFLLLKGVQKVTPGYMGGNFKDPSYEDICSGQTGHAEVIKVDYDRNLVSLASLFDVFFSIHDPTTLNRQGADHGTQYRSVIFICENFLSEATVLLNKQTQQKLHNNPIVTEIISINTMDWSGVTKIVEKTFWPAENYHINYFNKNPNNSYCSIVIQPKIKKLQKDFSNLVKI